MVCTTRKIDQYRRKGRSLISTNRINPQQWNISTKEAKEALYAQGLKIKQIKKIRCLKHQVCISYWDDKGNVCSSFFSYRIFQRWQMEVERLIYNCQSLEECIKLSHILQYEFHHYSYPRDMEDALADTMENHFLQLRATGREAIFLARNIN